MIPPKLLTQPPSTRPGNRLPGSNTASAQPLWAWVAVFLPVLAFALTWQYYAVNVPKWDDHALRAYLYYVDQETTVSGKIYQLFRQHNEHRIVFDRIVATLDYWLFGKLSYLHLMVLGNLSLVGLLALFSFVLVRTGKPLIYALPVSLLLFNLSHWENMFWGMAALQNFSVVLWAVLTIYLLSFTNRWSLAIATAILATLTSGNGLLIWPIGLLLVLLRTPVRDRQAVAVSSPRPFVVLATWVAVAAVVIVLYFTGFEPSASNPPDRGSFTDILKGWVAFTGSAAEAFSSTSPLSTSTRLGMLMILATLGSVGWSLRTHWTTLGNRLLAIGKPNAIDTSGSLPPTTLFFWGCTAFILATAAIVAWTRTSFGLDLIITSRYKVYSLSLLALLYVYAVVNLPRRAGYWLGMTSSVASLLFAWLSYNAFLDDTIWWRHYMLTSQFNWTHGTDQPVSRLDDVSKKYTRLSPAFYDTNPAVLYQTAQPPLQPVTVTQTGDEFTIENKTLPVQDLRDSRSFVVARSDQRAYLIPARQHQQAGLKARFWPFSPFKTGFTAARNDIRLDAGTYQLFILTVTPGGQLSLHPTGQSVTSAGQAAATLKKNW
ncbi:hypothetical protein [Spirosoma utsteinense]|uniref:Uncharacterized protein n=1 Tax=Spirosoma utsteinense TaxID=2585773 RepID=A0ABR6W527_9BACT|nr:hypothetical protein [Spirosoma utsteinense]MBC3785560.1 hypothetical protein [Spirosoma utsteinense]MBC3791708.1 hypothetical protein [Spirosoma utsteinense]